MIIENVNGVNGHLVCCGKPMEKLIANTTDAAQEKHVPVFTKEGNVVRINVGSTDHPMLPEHYIEWIEVFTDARSQRKYLKPGDAPVAEFSCPPNACKPGVVPTVRAYCNLHGLWEYKPE